MPGSAPDKPHAIYWVNHDKAQQAKGSCQSILPLVINSCFTMMGISERILSEYLCYKYKKFDKFFIEEHLAIFHWFWTQQWQKIHHTGAA